MIFNFLKLMPPPPNPRVADVSPTVFGFCDTGDQNQVFVHFKQALYQFSYIPSPWSIFPSSQGCSWAGISLLSLPQGLVSCPPSFIPNPPVAKAQLQLLTHCHHHNLLPYICTIALLQSVLHTDSHRLEHHIIDTTFKGSVTQIFSYMSC